MARRKVIEVERAALQAWMDLARAGPDEPLPPGAVAMLRVVATWVQTLVLCPTPPAKAARLAATRAGLTGVAIAEFRAEQQELLTYMCMEFNKHSKYRAPGSKVEHGIADSVSDVSARQAFRRRRRVLTKNQQ